MEELLYKNLFYLTKELLHNPRFKPILVNKDNEILNFLNLAIEEAWRVHMEEKYKINEVKDE